MTFDQLYNSIIQEAPLTSPVVPKVSTSAPGGMQSINAPQTPIKPQAASQQASDTNSAQSDVMNKQTNAYSANTYKIIKGLQSQIDDLTDALNKSQGIATTKKPSIMSPAVNPQLSA